MEKYVINPVQVRMKESEKGTVYQSIIAIGFRARQINDDIKRELTERMADIIPTTDESEGTNFDQISISREFDKYPKPTFMAMKEMSEDKITWEIPVHEEEDPEKI